MKADHHQAPTLCQHIQRLVQALAQVIQLLVDKYAYSLETTGGRMLALLTDGHHPGYKISQLGCCLQRSLLASFHNRTGNATGKTLFAVFPQYLRDLFVLGAGQPFRSAGTLVLIHTHIQGTILLEAETSLRLIQLGRRHPQVQQQPIHLSEQIMLLCHFVQPGKTAVQHMEALVAGKFIPAICNRGNILVQGIKPTHFTQLTQDSFTMTTAAKGPVYIATLWMNAHRLYCCLQEYGFM